MNSGIALIVSAMTAIVMMFAPLMARAAEMAPAASISGPWGVVTLAKDGGDWRLETYKVDRNLVAWSEVNPSTGLRRLYSYDGAQTRLLATMNKAEWDGMNDDGFYDPIRGSFDAADGLVVWIMTDGTDREVFSFDGESVKKVSDNTYDDKHPVTSRGRIAWTSVPGASYTLMVKDRLGIRRLDSWHVLNYAFSGANLFWLNRLPNENWFRVFRNDGLSTVAVGEADDRPVREYFTADGKGSAAWEYSTKRWDYDKRVMYLSKNGAQAVRMIQRDVPPNITRLEDVDGDTLVMNVTDLLFTKLQERNSIIRVQNGVQKTDDRQADMARARFMDGGSYVRHTSPENSSYLLIVGPASESPLSLDPVLFNRFDADGAAAAAAKVGGGLIAYADGKATVIPTSAEVADVDVANGDIAWTEGKAGSAMLRFATQNVLVKSGASAKSVYGFLAKTSDQPTVYLAAADGKRYVFSGEGQFYNWYRNFNSVRTVSKGTLASYPLGGNVLYRPGSRLLKTASSPRVYVLGKDASLHWVTDGLLLESRYGKNWTSMIDVIDESALSDYVIGQPVSNYLQFSDAVNGR